MVLRIFSVAASGARVKPPRRLSPKLSINCVETLSIRSEGREMFSPKLP